MKTLTIIVPVYNTEKYLRRCLNSILVDETRDALEVIAVNDGSRDNSMSILGEYATRFPGTLHIIDKENGGHGSAINAGLDSATGKYLRVLDSDDWMDTPEFIQFLHRLADCNEDLIVTPYVKEFVFNGHQDRYSYNWLPHNTEISFSDLIYNGDDMYFTIHSSTFRTSVIRECRMRLYEKCFYVDMQYIIWPIPYVKSVRVLDYTVYQYFIGRPEQSMSQLSMQKNFPQHQKVLIWLIDYFKSIRSQLSPNTEQYVSIILQKMYETHVKLLCLRLSDRHTAYENIQFLEKYVKTEVPDLYQQLDAIPCLHYSRKCYFYNILFFRRLFRFWLDHKR